MNVHRINRCICGHIEGRHPSLPSFPCEHEGCPCPSFILSDTPAPTATPPTTAERIADVLRANGLVEHPTSPEGVEQGIHSWRCGYPDRYDPCDCFAELVSDLAALFDTDTGRDRP